MGANILFSPLCQIGVVLLGSALSLKPRCLRFLPGALVGSEFLVSDFFTKNITIIVTDWHVSGNTKYKYQGTNLASLELRCWAKQAL